MKGFEEPANRRGVDDVIRCRRCWSSYTRTPFCLLMQTANCTFVMKPFWAQDDVANLVVLGDDYSPESPRVGRPCSGPLQRAQIAQALARGRDGASSKVLYPPYVCA